MQLNKLKSILLISNLYPNYKEPTRGLFIKQLAESLSKKALVTVIAPLPFNPLEYLGQKSRVPPIEKIGNITVYHPRYIVIPKMLRFLTGYFFYFGIKNLVSQLRRDGKADVISAHWIYPDGFASTLIAKKLGCPIALHALGCDINEYTKYKLRKRLIKKALAHSDVNIVKSQRLKTSIVNLGIDSNKTHVIHNGINKDIFVKTPSVDARQRLCLSLHKKYCLFIGNFQIEKGLEYLIKASALIKDDNLHFLIVGSGPLETEVKNLVSKLNLEKNYTFLGRIEHSSIPLYMSASNLLCLPSLREGCPNVVLESLSCGTPVVASDVGAVPDIITNDSFGIIVRPKEPNDLANGIIKGLNIDKNGMPDFDWYSWEENSDRILKLFNSII